MIDETNHARMSLTGPTYCERDLVDRNPDQVFILPSYKPLCPDCVAALDADILLRALVG